MAFASSDHHIPRRNARSFDLDDSAAKAAAWVWHLHTSKPGVTTEGRFISSQSSRRRSSGNYDRKVTRFQQEASITMTVGASGGKKTDTPMWDCGSNLYDTVELVAFGNRLDRSLMEVLPTTPWQARCPQEHHRKSPLHEPNGILRTLSLPRSALEQQTSKNGTSGASMSPSPCPSPSPSMLRASKSEKSGVKARSSTGAVRSKSSTRWSRVGNFMNVIHKVVVFHKQLSMVASCKRSTNVIESSQRPLYSISQEKDNLCARGDNLSARGNQLLLKQKVRATLSTSDLRENEYKGDDSPIKPCTKVSSNMGGKRGDYKLSIPNKLISSKYGGSRGDFESMSGDSASLQKKVKAYSSSEGFSGRFSAPASVKIRSNSEGVRGDFFSELKKIKPRRKVNVDDDIVLMGDGIKDSDLEGVNVKERVFKGGNEHYKHLHHHHHHHHHHHYLHHDIVASESARLSPETMSRVCADQSWLI